MAVSILITTFNRPKYLQHSLDSLQKQNLSGIDYEIVVINDAREDETPDIVTAYAKKGLRVNYLFTGQRNSLVVKPRVPGFALNIAIRQSKSEIVVLSNSDVFHIGETIVPIVKVVESNPLALATLSDIYDDNGELLGDLDLGGHNQHEIISKFQSIPTESRQPRPPADPLMPYCLGLRREHLIAIRGYDEDFIGYACEDVDLTERLCLFGCRYIRTNSEAVHLFHGLRDAHWKERKADIQYNVNLRLSRKGIIQRNLTKDWGVL